MRVPGALLPLTMEFADGETRTVEFAIEDGENRVLKLGR
jgi:hypothetical protein